MGAYKVIFEENFKVKKNVIFGSYVRREETLTSDKDILVDFEKKGKNFDNYIGLKYFHEELLGLEVDLVMKGALRNELRNFLEKILKEQ